MLHCLFKWIICLGEKGTRHLKQSLLGLLLAKMEVRTIVCWIRCHYMPRFHPLLPLEEFSSCRYPVQETKNFTVRLSSFFTTLVQYRVFINTDAAQNCPSTSCCVSKTSRYLNSLAWGGSSPEPRERHRTVFTQRTTPWDFRVLTSCCFTFMLQTFQVRAEGHQGGQQNHIICKSQRLQRNFWPWLHLEILSVKTKNRIGDRGQPWRGPIPAEKTLDLISRMPTQLSTSSYRDPMACNKGSDIPYVQCPQCL